jgi:hypothetical protein
MLIMKLHRSGVTLSLHSATWHSMVIWFLITFFQYFQVHHYKLEATEVINIAEANAKDMISGGALWELVRISSDCSREDIRSLARKTLSSITAFKSELRRLRIDYWLQLYLVLHISSRPTTCEADLLILHILLSDIGGAVAANLANFFNQEKQGFSMHFCDI